MYSTYEQSYWPSIYEPDTYSHSFPYQPSHFSYETLDDRQFPPGFPPGGGMMGPPSGFPGPPPPSAPPGQGTQAGPQHLHHHLLFPLKHSKHKRLRLIQGVLEDVYSDLRISG